MAGMKKADEKQMEQLLEQNEKYHLPKTIYFCGEFYS